MWAAFESGATICQRGSEGGTIIRDDEHPLGARITSERDTATAPVAITCGIYGWMVHTCFPGSEDDADSKYEKMKASLTEILQSFGGPEIDDQNVTIAKIQKFVETYH